MRILSGGEGHDHSHHAPAPSTTSIDGVSTSTDTKSEKDGLRRRKGDSNEVATPAAVVEEPAKQVKASAWLCIISDFTHNITDGLAISASFYISPSIGAVTTMAVFFHGIPFQDIFLIWEIPHEVGDFAILVQSGFTKYQAILSQLFTALGAFLGTIIGIAIQHFSASGDDTGALVEGIFGTSVTVGDLVLPFTAGT
jgi:solute carrier family 39 (zinc transporter), member 7